MVGMLGSCPLRSEVLAMGQEVGSRRRLKRVGRRIWREGFVTDNGSHIIDVNNLQTTIPLDMEARINAIPGVVTVGLFADRGADILLVGSDSGVRELRA